MRFSCYGAVLRPLILAFTFGISAQAALVHVESPDAGELLPSAQWVGPGVDEIQGSISPLGDIDLFRLEFDQTEQVIVQSSTPGTFFYEDFTIFNEFGNPLLTADPSIFLWDVVPGVYYFAIADWNVIAIDAVDGRWIADDYARILDPIGVLGGWVVDSYPLRGGDYTINFSIATAPEPSTALVVLLNLMLFYRSRRVL